MAAAKAEIEAFQYMLLLRGATTAPSCARSTLMFQYMLLLRGATGRIQNRSAASMFQYMLLLRGATGHASLVNSCIAVSIHAPLARSNKTDESTYRRRTRFNTCSSCEEQPPSDGFCYLDSKFQYMLLLRGATFPRLRHSGDGHVSIHAPLARSNLFVDIPDPATAVSIHAPLARSNGDDAIALEWTNVSIHAPLARSNSIRSCSSATFAPFQYMLLLRGATSPAVALASKPTFQYMLLLRGATTMDRGNGCKASCFNTCSSCEVQRENCGSKLVFYVSIHAPLARSNSCEIVEFMRLMFQYMLLLRGATKAGRKARRKEGVSIHAPLARSNSLFFSMNCANVVSIHAPLARSNLKREKLIPAA